MPLTQKDCERILEDMSEREQTTFLARFGYYLTIVGREAYEFQGPGVTNPRWLRDLNELHHRVHSQTRSLVVEGKKNFPADALASRLSGDGKPDEFRAACLFAFERCLPNADH
jgi:hypothetical protein